MNAGLALSAVAFSATAAVAQAPQRVGSPMQVLQDRNVQECHSVTAPQADPKLPPGMTLVQSYLAKMDFNALMDAVSTCRDVLALFPNEPSVLAAEDNAAEMFKATVFGADHPAAEADLYALALEQARAPSIPTGDRALTLYYLGSSNEFGIGTRRDLDLARIFYLKAAETHPFYAAVARKRADVVLQKAESK